MTDSSELTANDFAAAIRKNNSPRACWYMHPATLHRIRHLADDKGHPILTINQGIGYFGKEYQEIAILGWNVVLTTTLMPGILSEKPTESRRPFVAFGENRGSAIII
jgi:HK97 family phage major capsid protein